MLPPHPSSNTWLSVTSASIAILLAFASCLVTSQGARADGCIIGKYGRYIPEREQLAFIDWDGAREHLYVATKADASTDPSVWIVPVPAGPEFVVAEPVDKFPHASYTRSATAAARRTLRETSEWALVAGTSMPILAMGTLGSKAGATFSDLQVHKTVEKLGMVVEVISARSTDSLDRYLAERQLNTRAADIAALAPYLQEEYTLVCGWVPAPQNEVRARAVRIDFPTTAVFYPLRPTRIYTADVATAIYIRGWVRPRAGTTLSGMRCRYVHGSVTERSVDELASTFHPPSSATMEPLTRVELGTSPQAWTEDLFLEPGTPAAVDVARAVESLGAWLIVLAPAMSGVLLGTLLPWAIVPRDNRRWIDWVWACGVGLAMGLSLFVAVLVFYAWCWRRQPEGHWAVPGALTRTCVAVIALGVVLISISFVYAELLVVVFIAFCLVVPIATFNLARAAVKDRWPWLFVYAAANVAVVLVTAHAVSSWLAEY